MTDLPLSKLTKDGATYEIKDATARSGLANKQEALVSGTNIKTINNESILGSGNISISGGDSLPSQTGNSGKFLTTNGSTASWATVSSGSTYTAGDGIDITNNVISAYLPNQNTAIDAINPLMIWEGTEQQWNTGGEAKTWYNWAIPGGGFSTSTMPSSATWEKIAFGNGTFVALNGSSCAVSTDGIIWSAGGNVAGNSDIAYGNGVFVVVAGSRNVYYSTNDGASWSSTRLNMGQPYPQKVAFGNNRFVAVASTASSCLYSENGSSWTSASDFPSMSIISDMCYGNNNFVVIGQEHILYSSDGTSWTDVSISDNIFTKVAYGNNKFIILANTGIFSSTDAQTWTKISSTVINANDFIFADGKFVAQTANSIMSSEDGINWNTTAMPSQDDYYGIAYGANTFASIASGTDTMAYGSLGAGGNYFTAEAEPTTASEVYSEPDVVSALTITAVSSDSITLSDNETYSYNAAGNETTYFSVGETYPNWICLIEGVGIKKGLTMIANYSPVDQVYNDTSANAQSGVAVASGISDSLGTIETALAEV